MTSDTSSVHSLIGTYRLVAFTAEIDGQPATEVFGKNPKGYIVITPKRFFALVTAENRKSGPSNSAKAALLDTLIAYSGPYRVEGNRLVTLVDISWNEGWNGTEQIRLCEHDGNRLTITSLPLPDPRNPSKTAQVHLRWEKIE
jgi:hypothetical protein